VNVYGFVRSPENPDPVPEDLKKKQQSGSSDLKKSAIGLLRIIEKPAVGIYGLQKIRDWVAEDFGKTCGRDLRIIKKDRHRTRAGWKRSGNQPQFFPSEGDIPGPSRTKNPRLSC